MASVPFVGLSPAADTARAQWIVTALTQPPGVGFRVPGGYEAILRIHHPLRDGRRWADVFPEFLDGARRQEVMGALIDDLPADHGTLGSRIVDALMPVLAAATTTPDACYYALWLGWGDLRPGVLNIAWPEEARASSTEEERAAQLAVLRRQAASAYEPVRAFIEECAVQPWWGGRDMALFDGPIAAVGAIGKPSPAGALQDSPALDRRSPQWWWPTDRAWFVATEIDDPWTYLAGPGALIEAVRALDIEAFPVRLHDTW